MTEPTIFWSYDGTTESTGTRTYPNQEVGTATSWTSAYKLYNTGGSTASSCHLYCNDVSASHVEDGSVGYSVGTVASYVATTGSSKSIADLDGGGATNASTLDMNEYIYVGVGDAVGVKEWSKNISYQYS